MMVIFFIIKYYDSIINHSSFVAALQQLYKRETDSQQALLTMWQRYSKTCTHFPSLVAAARMKSLSVTIFLPIPIEKGVFGSSTTKVTNLLTTYYVNYPINLYK